MAPKSQSSDWPFLNLESRPSSLLTVDASGTAELPAGVERGNRFICENEWPEALLFRWLISGRTFYCSELYTLTFEITPGSRIAWSECSEDGGVVRLLAGAIGAPIAAHLLLLRAAYLVAVCGRLVKQAPDWLALSPPFHPFQRLNGVERVTC